MIGYQPFSRCFRQRGYYIDTARSVFCWDYSLTKNNGFTKSIFKRTPALCKRIYDEFNGGEDLFPKDALFEFDRTIERIRSADVFSQEVFEVIVSCAEAYLHENSFYYSDNTKKPKIGCIVNCLIAG